MASSTKTVECFVGEIILYLDEQKYKKLRSIYETLQKMKNSDKDKHIINYWKVLQCLGEVATEKLLSAVLMTKFVTCGCTYAVETVILQVFVETMSSMAVVKRVMKRREEVITIFLEAVRQQVISELVGYSLTGMYRLMIVGKSEVCEIYKKKGLLRDCYDQVKLRRNHFGPSELQAVLYCTKLLLGISELGDKSTRCSVKHSSAISAIRDYCRNMEYDSNFPLHLVGDLATALIQNYGSLGMLLGEERPPLGLKWSSKEKLKEELDLDFLVVFCSSPNCRKQCGKTEQFRYCGACKLTRYCSQDCQKEHWKATHKEKCLGQQ